MKIFATNKKATHDFIKLDSIEAGIVLAGHEVKSIRDGQINLKGSYIAINDQNEVWLQGVHIPLYKKATQLPDYDPYQKRKLLLKMPQTLKLKSKLDQKGLTLVPMSVYSKTRHIKVEISLVKGKNKADKRESMRKKDITRDTQRTLKNHDL